MIEQVNPNNENIKKGKRLTQAGMNVVLLKLIQSLGGKVKISYQELTNVHAGMAIRVEYDSSTDIFILTATNVNQSPIVIPKMSGIVRN